MPWLRNNPDLTNDPRYLEPRITEHDTLLAEKAEQTKVDALETRVNDVIQSSDLDPNKDIEVVDARNGSSTLGDEIRGKADYIKLTNDVVNGNFPDGAGLPSGWYYNLSTVTLPITNNEVMFTPTAQLGQVSQKVTPAVANHKYYVGAKVNGLLAGVRLGLFNGGTSLGYMSHSGSGVYENLSFIATIPATINEIQLRIIDYSTSGWKAIKAKQVVMIDLTKIFGAGNEPTKEDFENWLNLYHNSNFYVNGTEKTSAILATNLSADLNQKLKQQTTNESLSNFPLYVSVANDVLNVIFRYSDTKDMRVSMRGRGSNNIFDYESFYLIDNTSEKLSKDISGGTLFMQNASDWFGPHLVKAVNNINGDKPTSLDVTGGNHSYDGGVGGTPTGRTASIEFQVDGRKVTSFAGYCTNLDVYWNNRIQATNTKKADGTGREVLSENIMLNFDGHQINVDYNVEALEPVTHQLIYGLQCYNKAWATRVFYHNSINRKWNDAKIATNSGDKNCNRVTLNTGTHYVDMYLDNRIGLGKHDKLDLTYSAHTTTSDKTYLRLLSGNYTKEAGEIDTYMGSYRFYSKAI